MSILVINAGSSSLKFGLFSPDATELLADGGIDWTADPHQAELVIHPRAGQEERCRVDVSDHRAAVAHAVEALSRIGTGPSRGAAPISVVGHRVVHGGTLFRNSVRIDAGVKEALARLSELAPLHNPPALEAIDAAESVLAGVPQVAVFDTAFYADLPPVAYTYAVPQAWYTDWGIRRFGFHGISHSYCAERATQLLGRGPAGLRLVICHIGNGASATAVRDGKAVDTTMGFTPLEGLMMGTRSGSVDPGILLYVLRRRGLTPDKLDQALQKQSGLLGVSGVSPDYRAVEQAAQAGNEHARLALALYARRARAAVGALAVTLGGVDALVFTAGVGEHASGFRAAVCDGLECLGLHLDAERNSACQPDTDIATPHSSGRILVMHTREEMKIAQEARRLVPGGSPGK